MPSHQKRALTFMLMREKGQEPVDARSEKWKVFSHGGDDEPRYVTSRMTSGKKRLYYSRYLNIETGDICNFHPDEVKGGIIADAMGLGKSLSMISLLATDLPRQPSDMRSTLLIVPPSLLRSWEEQLQIHTHPDTLSHWKYHGPKRSHDLKRMLECDIILTTYDIVASEWRDLVKGPKPLYSQSWHRIVLDEGT